ncbi:hypothetical protein AB6809_34910 [Paraburkholderia sp. RCC_158]|uniref:hypothetical protein n=1 Tax=Paraburkholderia sp. RCC_158 TaxID=3239220 RepID=UPI003525463F
MADEQDFRLSRSCFVGRARRLGYSTGCAILLGNLSEIDRRLRRQFGRACFELDVSRGVDDREGTADLFGLAGIRSTRFERGRRVGEVVLGSDFRHCATPAIDRMSNEATGQAARGAGDRRGRNLVFVGDDCA